MTFFDLLQKADDELFENSETADYTHKDIYDRAVELAAEYDYEASCVPSFEERWTPTEMVHSELSAAQRAFVLQYADRVRKIGGAA